jgi:NAD(P)H dehydrogenase (quinone)
VTRSLKKVLQLSAVSLLGGLTTMMLASSENGNVNVGGRDRFIGAWRLAWLEEEGADGNVHRADCTGLLVYTRDGQMAVQVMYRNQQAGSSTAPVQYAQGGYEASYGTYQLDEGAHTFTFHVEGALVRTLIGKALTRAYEFSGNQLAASDAIVFGSPTYMGGPAAQFKAFADATVEAWFAQAWRDKLAAGFNVSGTPSGDKFSTLQYFHTLAMQHGMIWVGLGELPAQENGINRLGSWVGAMAESEQDSPEIELNDKLTGEVLGKRIARLSLKLSRSQPQHLETEPDKIPFPTSQELETA